MITEYKKYRSHIKKKSEQVLRLRKKSKSSSGLHKGFTNATTTSSSTASDPNNIQRQIEQSSRDLNQNYKQLYEQEKQCLRKVLIGNCNVYFLNFFS